MHSHKIHCDFCGRLMADFEFTNPKTTLKTNIICGYCGGVTKVNIDNEVA